MKLHATGIVLTALCVGSSALAQSTQAVEWKVSDGGNGHWYEVPAGQGTWPEMRDRAVARHGHLATVTSAAEWAWLKDNLPVAGTFVGAYQDSTVPDYSEPSGGWRWVNGEPFVLSAGQSFLDLDNFCASQHVLWFHPNNKHLDDIQDGIVSSCDSYSRTMLIEWDVDCNGDGIVDYGQILSGQLDDDNGDGIPDVCQYTVTGVIPVSGASSGGTAITVKGTNFPENPTVLIGGTAATDVVRVSATRITATTPAGLPGMTSVTVGNWVQPNAFYYRPECGSDLDQNGIVDAGDISIILLDFGSCYETPLAAPAPDVPPLLEAQPLGEAPKRK